jgi:transposase
MRNCDLHLNMAPHVSRDLKARIPALHYEHGFPVRKICAILNIKKTLVYSTLQLHRSYGVTHNIHAQKHQRRRNLSSIDLLFIRALLDQQHTVYLDEVQQQLLQRRGVKVSIPTLTRTLRQLHFTHKDISGKALEHNERHRAVFMNRIADLVTDPNMLMFGDEASKDERTPNRRKGWSRQGTRCVQRKCFVRGKRFSILPILTLDGIIAHDIIEGSVTSERFVEFLRELVVSLFPSICCL